MLMNILRVARQQLKDHIDLVPLAVILGSTGALSCIMMAYTALRKEDVVFNRWGNPMPWMHIDPTKHQQKLLVFLKSEKRIYEHDHPVESLRNEIYADGRYMTRVESHEN